ncbi:MAG: single-stranded DNA-binding protein [Bacilli bacterium]|jgi:single-strand DNA-binding protein|nr:single-stranded DNA-binding protein [Bacilli bacterium]
MNRVVVVGRLVKDPELKKTNNGSSVVSFTLAVDNRQRSNGERSASFFPCTAWNATAENVAKFMKKGSLVGVDGRLNQRSYQSRDGHTVNVIEIIAEQVQFLEKKGDSNNAPDIEDGVQSTSAPSSEKPVSKSAEDRDEPENGIDTTDDQLPF